MNETHVLGWKFSQFDHMVRDGNSTLAYNVSNSGHVDSLLKPVLIEHQLHTTKSLKSITPALEGAALVILRALAFELLGEPFPQIDLI
ncbi:MAG: hypothetical protein WBV22_08925 [Anaerolineaceae bacterium]